MSKPFLGVVHLPPLPSVASWRESFGAVLERALRDAEALAKLVTRDSMIGVSKVAPP